MLTKQRPPLEDSGAVEEFGVKWFLLRTNTGRERIAMSQVGCSPSAPVRQKGAIE